ARSSGGDAHRSTPFITPLPPPPPPPPPTPPQTPPPPLPTTIGDAPPTAGATAAAVATAPTPTTDVTASLPPLVAGDGTAVGVRNSDSSSGDVSAQIDRKIE